MALSTTQHDPAAQDHHIQPAIEVDAEATDNDSTYGNELSTYSASLTSSALDYRHENGRRYHSYRDGSYLLPNDEEESDRLDILHEMCLTIMGRKLFLAPIGAPQRVIDLATGTGIWAIEFGGSFNSTPTFLSLTLMSQPISSLLQRQVSLYYIQKKRPGIIAVAQEDILEKKKERPAKIFPSGYCCTKPGGWVEFQDYDGVPTSEDGTHKGTRIEQYYKEVLGTFEKAGYPTRPGPHLEEWFREAGFVDIHVHKYQVPMGVWPKNPHYKRIGTWNLLQVDQGFEAGAMAVLTRFGSWTPEEVTVLAAGARDDVKSRKIHLLFHFYVVYGRKPE
ncbi:hypothetical protein VTN77DRAFT_6386 [Rasamsonia byssochlamydoides]|uniref:uncharacterized protein n=1 Tax=Rasamsonia byssochlamydoides TaxID=89139 RepID=UPI0037442FCD